MQKIESKGKTEDNAETNKIQGLKNILNNKKKVYSNENYIFKEYIPENNNENDIEIIRPIPIRNDKDTFFLGKKKSNEQRSFST